MSGRRRASQNRKRGSESAALVGGSCARVAFALNLARRQSLKPPLGLDWKPRPKSEKEQRSEVELLACSWRQPRSLLT